MRRLDPWTADELAALLTAARGGRLEAAWHLAALAGLGAGELLALRWADVDLDHGRLHARHAVVGVPYWTIKPAPASRRARVIDIDPATAVLLRIHCDRQRLARAEWDDEYSRHDLVICREDGRALHPRTLIAAFATISGRARLQPAPLSGLRRTCSRVPVRGGALR